MKSCTELYGLAEGFLGKHLAEGDAKKVLMSLPVEVRRKCKLSGNSIRAYCACDG